VSQDFSNHRGFYCEQIVDASYLHTTDCFFIGPFASLVSFYSQQQRALDLVGALAAQQRLISASTRKPKKTAVIGAGLSGLTAAAALRAYGCSVDIFEQSNSFDTQHAAYHRIIHPLLARWPFQTLTHPTIAHNTEINFLDWLAGPCSLLTEALLDHWEEYLSPGGDDEAFRFFKETRVTTLAKDQGQNGRVLVEYRPSAPDCDGEPSSETYELVICTTGYATENSIELGGATSYWKPDWIAENADRLSEVRQSPDKNRKVVISGCGDGALIDALRLVHGDFRDGWLAIELAAEIEEPVCKTIRDGERNALMAMRSVKTLPSEIERSVNRTRRVAGKGGKSKRDIANALMNERLDGDITRNLKDCYNEAVEQLQDLQPDLDEKLKASLNKGFLDAKRVELVHPEEAPFVTTAAPIHKLMLAHAACAKSQMKIYPVRGVILKNKAKPALFKPDSVKPISIAEEDLVVRHGALPSIENIIGKDNEEHTVSLALRQFLIADYLDQEQRIIPPGRVPEGYPISPSRLALYQNGADASSDANATSIGGSTSPEDAVAFAESRFAMVNKMIRSWAKNAYVDLNIEGERYECRTHETLSQDNENYCVARFDRIQTPVFGVELLDLREEDAPSTMPALTPND